VALAVLPFFHIYGLNGVMNISLCVGRHTITIPRFDASGFAATIVRYKVNENLKVTHIILQNTEYLH
jgi:acyl-CoA synthetase (AMP-forming)/AMP-acid ligase II